MSLQSIKPRAGANLDYVTLFDEGCVKSYKNQLAQRILAVLIKKDLQKEVMKARKQFKTYSGYHPDNPHYGREKFGKKASKEADKVMELEREAFVKSREKRLFDKLTFIKDRLRATMFAVGDSGEIVKATFVNYVSLGSHYFQQSSISFFGERDIEGMKSIGGLRKARRDVAYMIPYASPEIKALWEEVEELLTPDHYENWHGKRLIQVYGGKYAKEDEGLEGEDWLERVSERAKELMKKSVD